MKCHYEVLGVPRDVTNDDLKKSYRKLALKWHPDKNLGNPEDAKEQFQLVQQAWEVLSDPHERAWYDNHREAILKGGIGDDYKDDSIDLFQYFTTSCFKGFGDDDKGFYTVYRTVFETLAAEDAEFAKEGDSDEEIPGFGDSTSSYEDVVHNFYAYWQSYTTRRSYAWLDPYDIRDTPNRRVLRLVEKENKKVRDKAKRERNEQVRNLAAFVRKRDKRVQAHARKLAQRAEENARKAQDRKKQQLLERRREMQDYTESEWSKFSNIEKELKVIEANLAAEFGEELSCEESSDGEETKDDDALYCVACNKIFKTQKAFTNHENSKKHRENVLVMKNSMLDEEKELQSSSEEYNSDSSEGSPETQNPNLSGVKLASGSEMPDFLLNPVRSREENEGDQDVATSDGEMMSDYDSGSKDQKNKRKTRLSVVELAVEPQMGGFEDSSQKVRGMEKEEDDLTSDGEKISDQEEYLVQKKKQKKKRGKNVQRIVEEEDSGDKTEFDLHLGLSKKQRKKQQQKKANLEKLMGNGKQTSEKVEEKDETVDAKEKGDLEEDAGDGNVQNVASENSDEDSEAEASLSARKASKGKRAKEARRAQKQNGSETGGKIGDKGKSDVRATEASQNSTNRCATCKVEFGSKNKLFDHLKKTGHSVYIPNVTKNKKDTERSTRGKRKSGKISD